MLIQTYNVARLEENVLTPVDLSRCVACYIFFWAGVFLLAARLDNNDGIDRLTKGCYAC